MVCNALDEAIYVFPNILKTIPLDRLQSICEKDPKNPLIYHLLKSHQFKEKVEDALETLQHNPRDLNSVYVLEFLGEHQFCLKDLDEYLGTLEGVEGLNTMVERLVTSFHQGYTEIESSFLFMKLFGNIILEPKLPNGKSADLSYEHDGQVFVEIIAPEMGYHTERTFERAKGKVTLLPSTMERAEGKILAELEHFKGLEGSIKSLLVINLSHTDFSETDIEDSLMGEEVILFKSRDGDYEVRSIKKADWTAFDSDNRLDKLGAIISYRKQRRIDGSYQFKHTLFVIDMVESDYEPITKLFDKNL